MIGETPQEETRGDTSSSLISDGDMAVETHMDGVLKMEQPDSPVSDTEEHIDVTEDFDEPMEQEESREHSEEVSSPPSSPRRPASPGSDSPPPPPAQDEPVPQGDGEPQPPQPARGSNFLIEDILKPEFGAKNTKVTRPVSSCTWRPFEDFKPRAYLAQDIDYKQSIHPAHRLGFPQTTAHHLPHVPGYETDHRRRCNSTASISSTDSSPLSSPKTKSPVARLPDLDGIGKTKAKQEGPSGEKLWPAWVYCTRYSDRPSSGPRSRKIMKKEKKVEEKRPRTAFTNEQLASLKREFDENRYLTEERRQRLAKDLDLNESQIKIWFQNKRAKAKKATGVRNVLALQLMAQGLYNHSTVAGPPGEEEDEDM